MYSLCVFLPAVGGEEGELKKAEGQEVEGIFGFGKKDKDKEKEKEDKDKESKDKELKDKECTDKVRI